MERKAAILSSMASQVRDTRGGGEDTATTSIRVYYGQLLVHGLPNKSKGKQAAVAEATSDFGSAVTELVSSRETSDKLKGTERFYDN